MSSCTNCQGMAGKKYDDHMSKDCPRLKARVMSSNTEDTNLFENNFHSWLEDHGVELSGLKPDDNYAWRASIRLNELKPAIMDLIESHGSTLKAEYEEKVREARVHENQLHLAKFYAASLTDGSTSLLYDSIKPVFEKRIAELNTLKNGEQNNG